MKGATELFAEPIRAKVHELSILSASFLTPLIFFLGTRDQFELPKLTLLSLLAAFLLLFSPPQARSPWRHPLSLAFLALFLSQGAASLPFTSLSWRTSLLGDYENFSGISTALLYLVLFVHLSGTLTRPVLEKALLLNALGAILSSLYAAAQRYGFDFIQWNPDTINPSREFASLGNPNFLAAYLAISLPLSLWALSRPRAQGPAGKAGPAVWLLGAIGIFLLLLGTGKALAYLGIPLQGFPLSTFRTLGLCLTSFFLMRVSLAQPAGMLWTGSCLMLLGLAATGSRGGALACLAGLGLWAFLSRKAGAWGLPRLPKLPLAWLSILSLAGLWVLGSSFLSRFFHSIAHIGKSLEESRLHIWRAAGRMVLDHPLSGVGLDCFKTAFPSYSGVEASQIDGIFVSSRTAHNEFLQTASTTGLPGLCALLVLLGMFLWTLVRAWKGAGPSDRGLLAALAGAALAYQVQDLFSFGVASIDFLWVLVLAAVLVLDPSRPPSQGAFPPLARYLSPALAFLFLLFPARRMAADSAFALATAAARTMEDPRIDREKDRKEVSAFGLAQNRRAVELLPLEVKYWIYLGQAYEKRAQRVPEEAEEQVRKAAACYERSIAMNPSNSYYHNNLGRIYSTLARWDPSYRDRSEAALEKAVALAPNSPYFMAQWALRLEEDGKNERAREAFRRGFALDPDFIAKVLAQTSVAEYDAGSKEKAFGHLALAIQGYPSGPEAYYVRGRLELYDGKKKAALADLRKARDLGPTPEANPSVKDLERYLEEAGN